MLVINVMAIVMDIVLGSICFDCDRRYGDGDGHYYKIEALMRVTDVMAMVKEVMDIVIGAKL